MNEDDLRLLRSAVQRLEQPALAGRLTKLLGKPIQLLGSTLPPVANALIASSSKTDIQAAVAIAKMTLANEPSTRSRQLLSCVEVFALGGSFETPDMNESSYFAIRGMLAASITEAARFIAQHGVGAEAGPVLVRFISQVASRFGIVLSQKLAAQAIPVIGALGGASVNYIFAEHFQELGQAYFTIRKLERAYGQEAVRAEYERIAASRT